jgi:hypothetical protein
VSRGRPRRLLCGPTLAVGITDIGLLVLTALSALGLWLGGGGPFGRELRLGADGLLRSAGRLIPIFVGCIATGDVKGAIRRDARRIIGLALATLGIATSSSLVALARHGSMGTVADTRGARGVASSPGVARDRDRGRPLLASASAERRSLPSLSRLAHLIRP